MIPLFETFDHIVQEEIFANHISVNFALQKELFVILILIIVATYLQ